MIGSNRFLSLCLKYHCVNWQKTRGRTRWDITLTANLAVHSTHCRLVLKHIGTVLDKEIFFFLIMKTKKRNKIKTRRQKKIRKIIPRPVPLTEENYKCPIPIAFTIRRRHRRRRIRRTAAAQRPETVRPTERRIDRRITAAVENYIGTHEIIPGDSSFHNTYLIKPTVDATLHINDLNQLLSFLRNHVGRWVARHRDKTRFVAQFF